MPSTSHEPFPKLVVLSPTHSVTLPVQPENAQDRISPAAHRSPLPIVQEWRPAQAGSLQSVPF
ncbi:MAG: hypothetical protein AAGF12_24325 [Myxococcota bacterium]